MIIVDVNLLVYAYNSRAQNHAAAKAWWERELTEGTKIALERVTLIAFIRLTTNQKIMTSPLTSANALDIINGWLTRQHVWIAEPGPRHWGIYCEMVRARNLSGNSLTDAHLAAVAVENDWTLCSSDEGFGGYQNLRWKNPLAASKK